MCKDNFSQKNKQCGILFCVRYPIFLLVNFSSLFAKPFSIVFKAFNQKVVANTFTNYLCACFYFLLSQRLLLTEQNSERNFRAQVSYGYAVEIYDVYLRIKHIHAKNLQAQVSDGYVVEIYDVYLCVKDIHTKIL